MRRKGFYLGCCSYLCGLLKQSIEVLNHLTRFSLAWLPFKFTLFWFSVLSRPLIISFLFRVVFPTREERPKKKVETFLLEMSPYPDESFSFTLDEKFWKRYEGNVLSQRKKKKETKKMLQNCGREREQKIMYLRIHERVNPPVSLV